MPGLTSPLQVVMDRSSPGPPVRSAWAALPCRVLLAASLLAVLLGVAVRIVAGEQRSSAPMAAPARGGFAALPVGAQGPISAALGADSPAYRIGNSAGGGLRARNPSQHMDASFQRTGVSVGSGTVKLRLSLKAVGYGSSLRALGNVTPTAKANRVSYAHTGLSEWYLNGPLGIEQGFTIPHALAASPSGPLTLSIALSRGVSASLSHGAQSITLRAGATALRYGGLSASDASGRTLRSWLALRGGHVLLRVDARGAGYPLRIDPLIEPSEKLTGANEVGEGQFGLSVALSADGTTALVGGPHDAGSAGSVWVFTHSGSTWSPGEKLTANEPGAQGPEGECAEEAGEEAGQCGFGRGLALSANGNTALIGAPLANGGRGAVWIFTRSAGSWSQGQQLTSGEETPTGHFGRSMSISADGTTALIGAPADRGGHGGVWVFERSGSSFVQQGEEFTGAGEEGEGHFGGSVALSADGNTGLVGGPRDRGTGAAWILTRAGSNWSEQAQKLTGEGLGEQGEGRFGASVALSGDGRTALIGGRADAGNAGAAWVFTSSGSVWSVQGAKLTGGAEELGAGEFGQSVALSGDGSTALIGAPRDGASSGAVWLFARAGGVWGLPGVKSTAGGVNETSWFGASVALSSDAANLLVGAPHDGGKAGRIGAVWVRLPPPTVTNVKPNQGPTTGGTSVEITGSNFTAASAVRFGSSSASFTVSSATSITAVSPAEPKGTVPVTVTTPDGTSAVTGSRVNFTFVTPKASGSGPGSSVTPANPSGGGGAGSGGGAAGGVLGSTSAGSAGVACRVSLWSRQIAVRFFSSAALRLLRTGTGLCRGTVTLRYKVKTRGRHFKLKTIGSAGFSISPGASQVVRIRLNKAGRAVLRARRGRLNASLAIVRAVPAPALGRTASVRLSVKKTPRSTAVKR